MHTQGSNGVGAAARHVAEHASSLARLELELALLELKRKAIALGVGIGLLLAAAVMGLFFVAFVYATIAAVLATFMATWLALLIVTAFLLLETALLAVFGLRSLKSGTPPVPELAIAEAKLTTEALKSNAR